MNERITWGQLAVPKSESYMDKPVGVGDDEFSEFLVAKQVSFEDRSPQNQEEEDDNEILGSDEEWVTEESEDDAIDEEKEERPNEERPNEENLSASEMPSRGQKEEDESVRKYRKWTRARMLSRTN